MYVDRSDIDGYKAILFDNIYSCHSQLALLVLYIRFAFSHSFLSEVVLIMFTQISRSSSCLQFLFHNEDRRCHALAAATATAEAGDAATLGRGRTIWAAAAAPATASPSTPPSPAPPGAFHGKVRVLGLLSS